MLRDYQVGNYTYTFGPDVNVSEYSDRNIRQRAKWDNRDTIFNVAELLTETTLGDFEYWVNETLNGGVDSYTGAYWDADVQKSATMEIVGGLYSFQYNSPNDIQVSYQIEVRDRDLTDAQNLYEYAEGGGDLSPTFAQAIEDAVNNNDFS